MKNIRILVLSTRSDLNEETLSTIEANAESVRQEPGCIQFEHYRSITNPDKLALIELWESAELYDTYWGKRLASRPAGQAFTQGQGSQSDRAVEFYHRQVFEMIDSVWTPVDPTDRIDHVRWP